MSWGCSANCEAPSFSRGRDTTKSRRGRFGVFGTLAPSSMHNPWAWLCLLHPSQEHRVAWCWGCRAGCTALPSWRTPRACRRAGWPRAGCTLPPDGVVGTAGRMIALGPGHYSLARRSLLFAFEYIRCVAFPGFESRENIASTVRNADGDLGSRVPISKRET